MRINRPDYKKQWSLSIFDRMFVFFLTMHFCSAGVGVVISEAKIPVQQLEGQRERGLILGGYGTYL